MAITVEPKRVLQLINSMGYKNVSATELKEFTKDVKRLIKYEQKQKLSTVENVPKVIPQVVHTALENVINVTIMKEATTKNNDPLPTTRLSKSVGKRDVQAQTDCPTRDNEEPVKQLKRLIRLPRHLRTKNPKVIYKKGIVSGVTNGVLVRNTPTDLYKKYQDDWIKFKSYIPGENSRLSVRRSIRKKMQQKDDDDDAKVYVHFPDETGDH